MRVIRFLPGALALAALAAPAAAPAQTPLARRILAAPDGMVRMSFASLPDVCGDGEHSIRSGRHQMRRDESTLGWEGTECCCVHGPVLVGLTVRDHQVVKIRTRVGGQWLPLRNSTDLGVVSGQEATAALLAIAADPAHPGGEDGVFPATLADSVSVWPGLLRLARNERAPGKARKQAVFWLSQAAGDSATAGLSELAEDERQDREVRTQAVFALSQRPGEEGVPALIRLARTNRDPEVRRTALFWLGQSNDPRALALFEELLTRK